MPNALIWGASGAIGGALVTALKAQNWTVYGAARNISAIPAGCDDSLPFDANEPQTFKDVALYLATEGIELDLVVYAAGRMMNAKMESIGADNWHDIMNVNLNGAYLGVESVLHLVPKGGHVVVIGAYTHKVTLPRFGAYVTAKAALEPMITVFAKENRKRHFTLVRPPAVDTPFWENVPVKLPDSALAPAHVAQKIIAHVENGDSGLLDL